jgi:hypothetical protein
LQARLYADLARFAAKLDPASAQSLHDKAVASGQALSGNDVAKWQRYQANAKKLAEGTGKDPAVAAQENKVQLARQTAIDEWTNFLQSGTQLSAPLFTDFKGTLDGLANSVPSGAENKSAQLFSNVQQQGQLLISALKQVRTQREKVTKDIKAAAKPDQ